jgi:hypothetical protein
VLGVGVEYFYFEGGSPFSPSRPRREREGGQYVPPQPLRWNHPIWGHRVEIRKGAGVC